MSRKPSKPETRIEDYLDVMTGGDAALPQPILRIEFYYAFLAGMAVELPQPILDGEKLLAKICGMAVEAPTYIPGISPRLYAYMAKKGGQDVQVPDPILRLERYWYDYSAGTPTPPEREYTGAVPVTFIADGTPLLDYIISGNTTQSGTPTPDTPIMPQGTGERTGNLAQWEKGGINILTGANEAYRTKEQGGTCEQLRTQYISCIGDHDYVLSVNKYPVQSFISFYDENKNYLTRTSGTPQGSTRIFRANANAKYMRIQIAHAIQDQVYPAIEENAQFAITLGSAALPYEPYGYKIPISSANTTTPVYLGEVETTRRIRKLVLDGTESWTYESQYSRSVLIRTDAYYSGAVRTTPCNCSHYQPIYDGRTIDNVPNESIYITSSSGRTAFNIKSTDFTSVTDFKAYLAAQYASGTPVTVWYVLTTEEKGIVNEPLMRIGDYADTLSMEQAGVQIPTANGSTTLDVETTVKPSEIYIKYRGEAVATLSSLPAEVSSPEETPEEDNPEEGNIEETEEEENER